MKIRTPNGSLAILIALARRADKPPLMGEPNRAQRRAAGERGGNYGLGELAVIKTRRNR